jgi:hypothetical protein
LQCQVWYCYITLSFSLCLKAAEQWVALFRQSPTFIEEEPEVFLRGFHYILTCAYNLGESSLYRRYLNELEAFRDENYAHFNENTKITSFIYVHYGRLNMHFLLESYKEGLEAIPATLRRLQKYKEKLDVHRTMVFYFKIAWMNLMAGNPQTAIKYINQILQMKMGSLREDIQGYSHLMFIMAHFDAGNEDILEYLVHGASQYFDKVNAKSRMQEVTIHFFHQWGRLPIQERKASFKQFYSELEVLEKDIFEMNSLLYLDIKAWVAQKITHKENRNA